MAVCSIQSDAGSRLRVVLDDSNKHRMTCTIASSLPDMHSPRLNPGITSALASAVLFGTSVPLAKILTGQISPVLLAGLLYLGSGIGLLALFGLGHWHRRRTAGPSHSFTKKDAAWLGGAVLFGGIIGPVLLMLGLTRTPASSAALLLNLEGVFTALLAWFVFKENVDRRIAFGMLLILMAGALLVWPASWALGDMSGALMITAACACWAIDNNLTRHVSMHDPLAVAGTKGLVAGVVNTSIALALGNLLPAWPQLAFAGLLGFLGYGVSLALFVLALRHVGAARTGAYFSLAPFIGAGVALGLLHESPGALFWPATGLMAVGLWLHLAERHQHRHTHTPLAHQHRHMHDAHHQHTHDFPWDGVEPHSHFHRHAALHHSHPHYPDIHHRHPH
jgi:drug/metabolite transporter (DMT)-like permease